MPSWLSTKLVLQAALVLAFAATLSGGIFLLVRMANTGQSIELILPTATATSSTTLKAYITGEVRNPGVYELDTFDRVAELVQAAGGATIDANLDAVNLATRLQDEDHWHIPRVGEAGAGNLCSNGSATEEARLNINTATKEQFVTLPGIGDVRAQAIVAYRDTNGPFGRIEDLLKVSGIGSGTLDGIRDLIEVC